MKRLFVLSVALGSLALAWPGKVKAQCSGYSTTSPGSTVLTPSQAAQQGATTVTITAIAETPQQVPLSGAVASKRLSITNGTYAGLSWTSNVQNPTGSSARMSYSVNGGAWVDDGAVPLSGSGYTGAETVGNVERLRVTVTDGNGNTSQDIVTVTSVAGTGPSFTSQDAMPTNFYASMGAGFKGPSMADACTLCQNQPYKCINKMHHPKQHWQATNSTSGEYHDQGWVYGNVACETCSVSYSGSSPFISFNAGDQLSFNVEDQVVCDEFGIIFDNNGGDTFDMETEYAFTTEQTKQSTCQVVGGGIQCSVAYFCKPGTTPPDFEPAAVFSNEFCANGVGKCTSADIPTFPPFWLTAGGGIRVRIGGWGPWFFPFYDTAGYAYGVRNKSEFVNFLFDVLDMAMPWTSTPVACTNADLGTGPLWWP